MVLESFHSGYDSTGAKTHGTFKRITSIVRIRKGRDAWEGKGGVLNR